MQKSIRKQIRNAFITIEQIIRDSEFSQCSTLPSGLSILDYVFLSNILFRRELKKQPEFNNFVCRHRALGTLLTYAHLINNNNRPDLNNKVKYIAAVGQPVNIKERIWVGHAYLEFENPEGKTVNFECTYPLPEEIPKDIATFSKENFEKHQKLAIEKPKIIYWLDEKKIRVSPIKSALHGILILKKTLHPQTYQEATFNF